jgi:thiol-disulfide isomerase/thioredoxin
MRVGRCLAAVGLFACVLGRGAASAEEEGEPLDLPQAEAAVGEKAPPVTATAWLNTPGGKDPLAGGLEGKVVLVEFWGTWCGPCVRAMPHIQELHEKYGPRGLLVVAITRETSEKVTGFLSENRYTMPVGCDPDQTCVKAYRVKGWPSTFVIGKDGNLSYAADPYGCEAAVEKALGLETDPAKLLTAYLDAAKGTDAKAVRSALERLAEKAPAAFDLKAWALAALGSDPVAPPLPPKVDAAKVMDALLAAWKTTDATKKPLALTPVALNGPTAYDLQAWARAASAKAYPVTKDELVLLLDGGRFGMALDALLQRNPSGAVLSAAAKHEKFVSWCKAKRDDVKKDARRGLMAIHYVFPGEPLGKMDEATQKKFWSDLSVSGMATDKEQKHVVGVLIGGGYVMKETAAAWVAEHLTRFALMTSIVDGKPLKGAALAAEAKKQDDDIVAELKRTY